MTGMVGSPAPRADSVAVGKLVARRGDLDALRSFAMLLGIVLHATLAYFPCAWPVQDPRQGPLFGVLFAAIHGFRMPLFFLLSGFFTMLVLRRRGLRGLLAQRALRILLPLAVAMATILPLQKAVVAWGVRRGVAVTAGRSPLAAGILAGDATAVARALADGSDPAARDPVSGVTLFALAAMRGDATLVAAMLDAGGPIDCRSRDGGTPLHGAAFVGAGEVVELLLSRGSDPTARNLVGKTPLDTVGYPADVPMIVCRFLGLPEPDEGELVRGRRRAAELLAARTPPVAPLRFDGFAATYRSLLESPALSLEIAGRRWHPFVGDVFDHLWFLWYLCWLVAALALAEVLGLAPTGRFRWWLLPASCLPYAVNAFPFGPDTAIGILPAPHVLLFYACFFWFGAATFAAEGTATALGRHWKATLPLSFGVLFPAGLVTIGREPFAATLQPAFAWATSLGLIGLFHACFAHPSARIRWLGDATYWMYLAHVPLVIVGQALLVDRPWPAVAKFVVVTATSVAILLVSYRWCVRYTPIGWLLNGPRPAGGHLTPRADVPDAARRDTP